MFGCVHGHCGPVFGGGGGRAGPVAASTVGIWPHHALGDRRADGLFDPWLSGQSSVLALRSGHGSSSPALLVVAVSVAALAGGYAVGGISREPRPGRLLSRGVALGMALPAPRRSFWIVVGLCVVAVGAFALYAPKVGINSPTDLSSSRKRFGEVEGGQTVFGYHRFAMSLAGIGFVLGVYTIVRRRLSW